MLNVKYACCPACVHTHTHTHTHTCTLNITIIIATTIPLNWEHIPDPLVPGFSASDLETRAPEMTSYYRVSPPLRQNKYYIKREKMSSGK